MTTLGFVDRSDRLEGDEIEPYYSMTTEHLRTMSRRWTSGSSSGLTHVKKRQVGAAKHTETGRAQIYRVGLLIFAYCL